VELYYQCISGTNNTVSLNNYYIINAVFREDFFLSFFLFGLCCAVSVIDLMAEVPAHK
jgi:hypothetical protein